MPFALLPLIKYAAALLLIGWALWAIHDNGRDLAAGECAAEKNKALARAITERDEALRRAALASARAEANAAANLRLNDEVTSNAQKAMEAAAAADAAIRRDSRGLQLPPEVCSAALPLPGSSGGTEHDNAGGRPEGIRLPKGIEESLYDLTLKANTVRVKRDECQEFARGLALQREQWEKEQAEQERP